MLDDDKRRRKWKRRWREVGAIMNEEDLIEISIMNLFIPNYEGKEEDGLILPSECSFNAMTVVFNERSDWRCTYHGVSNFDVRKKPYTYFSVI